jgi:hypothetical protein
MSGIAVASGARTGVQGHRRAERITSQARRLPAGPGTA